MVSLGTMIKTLEGLLGTKDISSWEEEFLESVVERTRQGTDTSRLTEKQIGVIERLHKKHFGD